LTSEVILYRKQKKLQIILQNKAKKSLQKFAHHPSKIHFSGFE